MNLFRSYTPSLLPERFKDFIKERERVASEKKSEKQQQLTLGIRVARSRQTESGGAGEGVAMVTGVISLMGAG